MKELIGLNWSVVPRPEGNAQIRFRLRSLPPGKQQVAISTGYPKPDHFTKQEQAAIIWRWAEANGIKLDAAPMPVLSFNAELERFLKLQYDGQAESTVSEAKRLLEQMRDTLGIVAVPEITKKLVEAKRDALREGRSPKYWKNFLTAARKFARWQLSEGHLKEDPLVNLKNPSRKTFGRRTAIWSEPRFEATLAQLSSADRDVMLVLRWTGMDISDLYHLAKEHIIEAVDEQGRRFWKLYKLREKAKSEEEVMDQPLSTKIESILMARWNAQADPQGRLWTFTQYADDHTFATALLERVKRAQVRAGQTPTMDIKSLRHTFATYHANRYVQGQGGPPMEELRRWMGHARDSRVLERLYVHAKASGRFMN